MAEKSTTDNPNDEERYSSEEDYQNKQQTKSEIAERWAARLESAERIYRAWANRFKVPVLYQYYEGFQFLIEQDENNKPYVVNLVYSTIEGKLPNLIFDSPTFVLRPHPSGETFDFDKAVTETQLKEDALNYVCSLESFGITDKHELAILDAFFGYGVLEIDYSADRCNNPQLSADDKNPLNKMYCKHIPFDTFRVSAQANWDLSEGKWWGYYEFVPYERLQEYVKKGILIEPPNIEQVEDDFAALPIVSGKIVVGEGGTDIPPNNCVKIWHLWDYEKMQYIKYCPDGVNDPDRILETKTFKYCPLNVLRFTKRRRGWYPLPPVFQWLSPQDEINDIRQTHRIHRKRYSRKYMVQEGAMNPEEEDKFLYGPDGTVFKVNKMDGVKAVEDAPLDTANQESLIVSYDDMNRVSGTSDEQRAVADRQTATQSTIINSRSQIRESKDLLRVGTFMNGVACNILRALGKAGKSFWVLTKLKPESLLGEIKTNNVGWKKIPPQIFKNEDHDVDINVSSISPIYQQKDKTTFMEFLAVITQYEVLTLSPELIREAAYRIGYKNERVLKTFQQFAQLAALGKMNQMKQAVAGPGAIAQPQGAQPGQLPQQQVAASTPPTNQDIMNTIFNRQGVQQPQ